MAKLNISKRTWMIVAFFVVLVVVIVFYYTQYGGTVEPLKEKLGLGGGKKNTNGSGNTTAEKTLPDASFPLKQGSYGQQVKDIQHYLNYYYKAGLTEDGDFGPKTKTAVKKYLGKEQITEAEYNFYFALPNLF